MAWQFDSNCCSKINLKKLYKKMKYSTFQREIYFNPNFSPGFTSFNDVR